MERSCYRRFLMALRICHRVGHEPSIPPSPPATVFSCDIIGYNHQMVYGSGCTIEEFRSIWHGLCILLRPLAESNDHKVSGFTVATHHLITSINCHILDQACQEYTDFAALLAHHVFHRLDLAPSTGDTELDNWSSLHGGLLREAVATDLEHPSLSSNLRFSTDLLCMAEFGAGPEDVEEEWCLPLQTVFPYRQMTKSTAFRHYQVPSTAV